MNTTKTNRHIYIVIAVDTDRVRREYPNPSQDPKNPTGVPHDIAYMVATGRPVEKQGTGDLKIFAQVGDVFNAWATCPSNSFNDAVVLYGLPRFKGDEVLSKFKYVRLERNCVVPGTPEPLPPVMNHPREIQFFRADVIRRGKEGYKVQFALYNRDARGAPKLYGCFYWDPEIEVEH